MSFRQRRNQRAITAQHGVAPSQTMLDTAVRVPQTSMLDGPWLGWHVANRHEQAGWPASPSTGKVPASRPFVHGAA